MTWPSAHLDTARRGTRSGAQWSSSAVQSTSKAAQLFSGDASHPERGVVYDWRGHAIPLGHPVGPSRWASPLGEPVAFPAPVG